MDISDIDLVIVYGVPDSMNQLYQVQKFNVAGCNKDCTYVFLLKLCGRTGRGGSQARAHIFYNKKQKNVNAEVREFCESKENCRRQQMLKCVGSDHERVDSANVDSSICCDICSGVDSIPANLKFESFTASIPKAQPQKRRRVRKLSQELAEQLKSSLLREREKYMNDHPYLRFLGPNGVCPTCYIDNLCEMAHCIQSEDDSRLSRLNFSLKHRFFNIVQHYLSLNTASSKRARRM